MSARVEPSPSDAPRRPRWGRRLLVAAVAVTVLAVFHAPLLRSLAGLLVASAPGEPAAVVVLMGQSGPFQQVPIDEVAAALAEGGTSRVLLLEDRTSRVVRAGVIPTLESVLRRELRARGVPDDALTVLAGEYGSAWASARGLRAWLEEHPGTDVTILCGEFHSRRQAHITRGVMGSELSRRVRWRALPDDRFNTSNWWHTRQGVVELCGAYVALGHTYVMGEPPEVERWDPEAYERTLKGQDGR
jgi:hypothetical protein